MEPLEALSFISFAFSRRDEEMLFQRWISGPQFEMGFDEFKGLLMPKPEKPEVEIMEDVKRILSGLRKEELRGNI